MAKSSAQGASDFDGLTVESAPDDMDWWTPSDMTLMLSTGRIGIVVHYNETDCAGVRATYQAEYGSKLSFICEDKSQKKYRHF
jgi:cysteinyl-tRNA synthetase, unknown class